MGRRIVITTAYDDYEYPDKVICDDFELDFFDDDEVEPDDLDVEQCLVSILANEWDEWLDLSAHQVDVVNTTLVDDLVSAVRVLIIVWVILIEIYADDEVTDEVVAERVWIDKNE